MEETYLYNFCRDMLWWLCVRSIITEDCHVLEKFQYGDNLMADKGFSISDLLISKQSQLIIPPFLREKQ